MNLCAKLAVSQIKNNKRRAFFTAIGTTVSITALYLIGGFSVSAITAYYARFGSIHPNTFTFIAAIGSFMGFLVTLLSVVMISGSFKISVTERLCEISLLKSVGAVKKQIFSIVFYEGLFLYIVAMPIGIVLGVIMQFFGTEYANSLLAPMNVFLFAPLEFAYTISLPVIITVSAISFAAVMISGWIPVKKTTRISISEGLRGIVTPQARKKATYRKTPSFVQNLFGFEGVLAAKAISRNKKQYSAVILSLTIGIVLMFAAASYATHLAKAAGINYEGINANLTVEYYSLPTEGNSEVIDYYTAQQVTERLRAFEKATIIGVGFNYGFEVNEGQFGTIIVPDSETFAEISENAGTAPDSNILINVHRSIDEQGFFTLVHPHNLVGSVLNFKNQDGFSMDFEIHGEITSGPSEIINMVNFNIDDITIVVPNFASNYYVWFCLTEDKDDFKTYATAVMDEIVPIENPELVHISVIDISELTEAYRARGNLTAVIINAFVIVLVIIGLTNIVVVITTSISLRKREFNVLRSLGITQKGIRKMLTLESLFCSAKAIIIGIPVGSLAAVAVYYIVLLTGNRFAFSFPLSTVFVSAFGVISITLLVTVLSAMQYKGRDIVKNIV